MARFCDRSPCDRLLGILGRYLFGDPDTGGFVLLVQSLREQPDTVEVEYCPFCGHRLEKLEFETGRKLALDS